MATHKQRAANQSNACKSTGPTSSKGKAKSSANARRHGLSADTSDPAHAEDLLAELLADFPEDFAGREEVLLETLASTQARLNRATTLEGRATRDAAEAAARYGDQVTEITEARASARACAGYALAAGRRPIGSYTAQDFRFMAATFRLAARAEPDCPRALENLRKLGRYTRDGEALRRKLIKRLAEIARDSASPHSW